MSLESEQRNTMLGVARSLSFADLWGGQLRQFVLYGAVSVAALAVDYALLIFLTEYVGLYYLVSATISFLAGMLLVYATSVGFIFGGNRLWIDRVESVSHAELWLELTTDNVPGAAAYVPWVLDSTTPEHRQHFLAARPGPVAAINTLFWERRYRRRELWKH